MFKASFKSVNEWKAILNVVSNIVDEIMFICNHDGVSFRAYDDSHVSLINITMPKSSFLEFECEPSYFAMRVDELKTVINNAEHDDVVTLQINGSEILKITVVGKLVTEYNIGLTQKSLVNIPIPKINYKSKISLKPLTLCRIISNCHSICDYITINSKPNSVQFSGRSDVGETKVNIKKGSPELEGLEVTENSSSAYSLEYMAEVIRGLGRASKVLKLQYASQKPICVEFELPSSARVEYYLAPRILDQ